MRIPFESLQLRMNYIKPCRGQVLTRAHDAAAAQLREEEGEVIDLTARRASPAPPAPAVPAPPAAPAAPAAPAEPAPLARALSSPLVGARAPATGLAYDPLMLKHGSVTHINYPGTQPWGGSAGKMPQPKTKACSSDNIPTFAMCALKHRGAQSMIGGGRHS